MKNFISLTLCTIIFLSLPAFSVFAEGSATDEPEPCAHNNRNLDFCFTCVDCGKSFYETRVCTEEKPCIGHKEGSGHAPPPPPPEPEYYIVLNGEHYPVYGNVCLIPYKDGVWIHYADKEPFPTHLFGTPEYYKDGEYFYLIDGELLSINSTLTANETPVIKPSAPKTFTTADALTILKYSVGEGKLSPEQRANFDFNNDGNINSKSALIVLRIIAGLEV